MMQTDETAVRSCRAGKSLNSKTLQTMNASNEPYSLYYIGKGGDKHPTNRTTNLALNESVRSRDVDQSAPEVREVL